MVKLQWLKTYIIDTGLRGNYGVDGEKFTDFRTRPGR